VSTLECMGEVEGKGATGVAEAEGEKGRAGIGEELREGCEGGREEEGEGTGEEGGGSIPVVVNSYKSH
jgi:hypothetical protein